MVRFAIILGLITMNVGLYIALDQERIQNNKLRVHNTRQHNKLSEQELTLKLQTKQITQLQSEVKRLRKENLLDCVIQNSELKGFFQ